MTNVIALAGIFYAILCALSFIAAIKSTTMNQNKNWEPMNFHVQSRSPKLPGGSGKTKCGHSTSRIKSFDSVTHVYMHFNDPRCHWDTVGRRKNAPRMINIVDVCLMTKTIPFGCWESSATARARATEVSVDASIFGIKVGMKNMLKEHLIYLRIDFNTVIRDPLLLLLISLCVSCQRGTHKYRIVLHIEWFFVIFFFRGVVLLLIKWAFRSVCVFSLAVCAAEYKKKQRDERDD